MDDISAFGVVHKRAKDNPETKAATAAAVGAGGVGGAVGAAGGKTGLVNVGRAINHSTAMTHSSSLARQGAAVLHTKGVGAVAGAATVAAGAGGLLAHKSARKYQEATPGTKKKIKLGSGAAAVGGAALGLKGAHNYKLFNEAAKVHHTFASDPVRSAKLARDLAGSQGNRVIHDVGLTRREMRKPHNRQSSKAATRLNPDTKKVRRSVNDWSRSNSQVKSYRRALEQQKAPGKLKAVVSPKARNFHQARTLQALQQGAPKTGHTVFRATELPKGTKLHPGSTVDMHHLSSWTGDKRVADVFTSKQQNRRSNGGEHAILRLKGAQGLHAAPASRTYAQDEWIAGGKLKVVNSHYDSKAGRHVVDVEHHHD